ncbi:hypothetical protein [Actinokineospora diospyrosa]|uniref:DUF317 domain-containing protein n=1 Tax=Actinokineospora diospyrosa TaxID=103728 RepID=A0ABT1IJB6_9PSEU|nr:hypothetical protein [Actinokineospora diospyrosa]MCP2272741.1 hypothetical protein [Actinokineospora diospyrosa]
MNESSEQRLYQAVRRWQVVGAGPRDLIHEACLALVDGLDSPGLRDLAGASARDSRWEIDELVRATFAELGIPAVGTVPLGFAVAAGGGVIRRAGVDTLRLAVAPGPREEVFQVLVEVNGTEMTTVWGARGVDPDEVLLPDNLLVAGPEPRVVPIVVTGEDGIPHDGSFYWYTENAGVTITRDGDVVHWDWSPDPEDTEDSVVAPNATFTAAQYDRELARFVADHAWETPLRTARRLVHAGIDRDRLRGYDLTLGWVGNKHREPGLFRVTLITGHYSVWFDTPGRGRGPEEVAREVCAALALPPEQWQVSWQSHRDTTPPAIAGPGWQQGS